MIRNSRVSSLDPISLSGWRWTPFLDKAIQLLNAQNPEPCLIAPQFLHNESNFVLRGESRSVVTQTWACKTSKLRNVRSACLEAGPSASVLNFVASPFHTYEIPFFGADFVTLPSGHLLALDFQPALPNDELHIRLIAEYLTPLHNKWQSLLPDGGPIPEKAKSFFSPGFLWTRIPLGEEGDRLISEVIWPAFCNYFQTYLEIVEQASLVDDVRALMLLDGQKQYKSYRAINDPARAMLTRFYGAEWTETYIHDVLFDF